MKKFITITEHSYYLIISNNVVICAKENGIILMLLRKPGVLNKAGGAFQKRAILRPYRIFQYPNFTTISLQAAHNFNPALSLCTGG